MFCNCVVRRCAQHNQHSTKHFCKFDTIGKSFKQLPCHCCSLFVGETFTHLKKPFNLIKPAHITHIPIDFSNSVGRHLAQYSVPECRRELHSHTRALLRLPRERSTARSCTEKLPFGPDSVADDFTIHSAAASSR